MTGRFDGRVGFISGAASGIGRETASRFAGEGGRVVLADRDEEGGRTVLAELQDAGLDACFITGAGFMVDGGCPAQ